MYMNMVSGETVTPSLTSSVRLETLAVIRMTAELLEADAVQYYHKFREALQCGLLN